MSNTFMRGVSVKIRVRVILVRMSWGDDCLIHSNFERSHQVFNFEIPNRNLSNQVITIPKCVIPKD